MKALIRTLLFLPLPLMFASCDREEIPLREDSLYAHPIRHFPGSDPGVTPPGGSSSQSSDTMTNPPAAGAPAGTAAQGNPPAGAGGQAAGSTSGGSSSGPSAGGQGKPQDEKKQ